MNILVIDDDPICEFLAKSLINHSGLFNSFSSFRDPLTALEFILDRIKNGGLPEIILLDINMPLMDGWEFLELLPSTFVEAKIKSFIYIVTSSTDISDINRANYHPLVTDIIAKPLTPAKLQAIYEQVKRIGL